tara:strand:- start:2229 stop:2435 length:207 start_codon:yes stop_codon:yes gene_type:complete
MSKDLGRLCIGLALIAISISIAGSWVSISISLIDDPLKTIVAMVSVITLICCSVLFLILGFIIIVKKL